MMNYLSLFQNNSVSEVQNSFVAKELIQLNKKTQEYGITLSAKDCLDIAQFRNEALIENQRIEIGLGAVEKIIELFCDSPYINQHNFTQTIEALLECFYTIKTETLDKINDDSVLDFLVYLYENVCGGDINKLYDAEAFDLFINKALAKPAFYNHNPFGSEDNNKDNDGDN